MTKIEQPSTRTSSQSKNKKELQTQTSHPGVLFSGVPSQMPEKEKLDHERNEPHRW